MTLIKVAPGANDCPLTDNAIAILEKRYLAPNETIDGLWDRVSGGNPIFRNLLSTLRFLPNSPTLFNAGLNNGCTLSACFVFDIDDEMGPLPTDSLSSIHNTRGKAISVAKAGGGVGYYFGHIRPKNSIIKSVHRKACGPVAVLRDCHGVRQLITQGGKRDLAQMGVLPVWHEDIDEFIHCKNDNPKALESFNISVSWTDEALNDVNFNDPLDHQTRYSRLWWEQCISAWRTGDPGMLFFDTVNRANPNPHLGMVNATNPCLTAETLVAVADGRGSVPIGELARSGKDVPVYCQDDQGGLAIRMMRHPRLTGSRKPIVRVTLDNGESITCTTNHKFLLRNGQYVEAKSLKEGDSLRIMTRYIPENTPTDSQSYADRYTGLNYRGAVSSEHVLIAEFVHGREVLSTEHVHHIDHNRLNNTPNNLEIIDAKTHLQKHSHQENNPNSFGVTNKQLLQHGRSLAKQLGRRFSRDEWEGYARNNGLPTTFSHWRQRTLGDWITFSRICAELEGVGEYNGINPKRVRVYQDALEAGLNAEIMDGEVIVHKKCENCANPFTVRYKQREQGYCSKACSNAKQDKTKMIASLKETNDQKQATVREHQIKVFVEEANRLGRQPKKEEWKEACKLAGVSCEISRKSSPFRSFNDLISAAEVYNHKVVSVEPAGNADVYNGTVDDYHNFFLGGFDEGVTDSGRRKVVYCNSVQCGETPNRNNEPCNLGSLVASRYYSPGNRSVDWNLLEEDTWNASLFLDDILDRNVFPHPEITRCALLTRKLGLGVMGWADLLAKLHIHYDSPAALELADKFMSLIKDVSTAASVHLGHVKGPYEGYCPTRTKGVKRRNETNTSIAPTGTIAIIAGCDSWSIEPHFGLDVTRTTNEGIKMKEKYDADKYDGFIPKVSDEISIDAHVRMQAAFQKHTDLGVSKTINLPNNATVKDVSNAYHLMYSLGCKGGTVFRNGCRSEQVLVKNETPSVYSTNGAPPAPRIIEVDKAAGESWTSVVSMDLATSPKVSPVIKESKAVWTPTVQKAKPLCKPNHRPGHICKFKVGSTSFYLTVGLTDEGMPREIFVNGNFGTTIGGMLDAWCINFSVSLQNGVELSELINHHKYKRFEPCGPTDNRLVPICTSIPDLIVRWLNATYLLQEDVKAETGSESGVYCPECSTEATYQAGCLTCPRPGCGWSRCG